MSRRTAKTGNYFTKIFKKTLLSTLRRNAAVNKLLSTQTLTAMKTSIQQKPLTWSKNFVNDSKCRNWSKELVFGAKNFCDQKTSLAL